MRAPHSRAATRVFISALLVASFVHAGSAGAGGVRDACIGTDGSVSVLDQVTYTDSAGYRWLDAVVSNDSSVTIKSVEIPVTYVSEEGPKGGTNDVCVDGRLLEPGQTASVHYRVSSCIPSTWTPQAGQGGGWASDARAYRLEVASAEPVVVEGLRAQGYYESAERTYQVTVRNSTDTTVTGVSVFGAEYQGADADSATLLDTVAATDWCNEVLSPGETMTVKIDGYAPQDDDPETVLFPRFTADAAAKPIVALDFDTRAPAWGVPAVYYIRLLNPDGTPASGGRTLKLASSVDGKEWTYQHIWTDTNVVAGKVTVQRKVWFKAIYWGDDEFGYAETKPVYLEPVAEVTTPSIPQSTCYAGNPVTAAGLVRPERPVGSHEVKIQCYRYENGSWVYRKTVASTAKAYPGSYTRYVGTLSLPKGRWRVRGYRAGDNIARTDISGYDYLTVR